ncbi:Rne/Rng family ribonuclease [Alkalihalobacillus sp. AL-G]|uniref:Rne/Rng family ribonuclease n=1 Tax=Alkalihalobacillus sp. AL-G TaxID=2926399 RepID=UPI00272C3E56|nr:Rne/Rng family ribonuclease [Alkalihalobacillus sp. AL-G]WLD92233.1 Rne/Rng family ribonuclease [Alkalihalobacillus sp. AL-G]
MKQIILNIATSEKRAAILEDGRVKDILIDRPDSEARVGSIYLGKAAKVLSGIQAAFINIGTVQNGFVHAKDLFFENKDNDDPTPPISQLITEGQSIIVQVKKEASQTKGPLLTKNITLRGKNVVFLPHGNYIAVSKKLPEKKRVQLREVGSSLVNEKEGLIMRTSSEHASIEDLTLELMKLREQWNTLQSRANISKKPSLLQGGNTVLERAMQYISNGEVEIVLDDFEAYQKCKVDFPHLQNNVHLHPITENIFSYYQIDAVLDKGNEPYVWLKNGGHLVIDSTEAMTVVDVNTGKFTGRHDRETTVLETNLLAAKEASHQIRLRNISGMILIDFIRMKNQSDQDEVFQCLQDELSKDPVLARAHGYTTLGLMEVTRKKMQESLPATLTGPCSCCNGNGRTRSIESAYYSLERDLYELRNMDEEGVWVVVSKSINNFLRENGESRLDELSRFTPAQVYVTEDRDLQTNHYMIKHIGSTSDIEDRISHREN